MELNYIKPQSLGLVSHLEFHVVNDVLFFKTMATIANADFSKALDCAPYLGHRRCVFIAFLRSFNYSWFL